MIICRAHSSNTDARLTSPDCGILLPQVMRMTPYDTPAKRAGDAAQPCIDAANFVTIDATVERGCAAHQTA